MSRSIGVWEFTALAACLMSLFAFSIDATLPALGQIGADLNVNSANDSQLIVFVMVLGMGIGQLAYGPLSDIVGRKPSIFAGLALYAAGCLVSIFATVFPTMLAGRLLQGLGAAGPRIVTLALVRDQYSGTEMARIMSFIIAVLMIGPVLAPLVGQGILLLGTWRLIFVVFFLIALTVGWWFMLRQPETLQVSKRVAPSLKPMMFAMKETIGSRVAVGYTLVAGVAFGELFAYIGSARQVYQEIYQVGSLFPLYLAVSALAIAGASIFNAGAVRRFGMRKLCIVAACLKTVAVIVIVVVSMAFDGAPPLWVFVVFAAAFFFFVGILFGNLNAMALEPLGHVAGVAAGIVGSASWVLAAGLGVAVGQSFDGTIVPLSIGLVALSAVCIVLLHWTAHGGGGIDAVRVIL